MIYDIDSAKGAKDFIGKCESTMGKVMGALRQTFVGDVLVENNKNSRGKIIIRLDNVKASNDEARMKISAKLVP